MAMLSYSDLRNGVVFKQYGETFLVLKYTHVKQGRGSATVKVKVKNIKTGSIFEKSFKGNEKVESAEIEHKETQYLYKDADNAYFMDIETYEQISVPLNTVEDSVKYLKEGEKAVIKYLDNEPLSVDIPKRVELKVEYTEPAIAGNTSGTAMKIAKLETGLEIHVPLFVNIGDIVIINTELNTYISRK